MNHKTELQNANTGILDTTVLFEVYYFLCLFSLFYGIVFDGFIKREYCHSWQLSCCSKYYFFDKGEQYILLIPPDYNTLLISVSSVFFLHNLLDIQYDIQQKKMHNEMERDRRLGLKDWCQYARFVTPICNFDCTINY